MQQFCECKPPINFSVEFPNHKVVIPNSHEYQFEAFIYTCVILLNYLFLTTILMVKLICFAPARVTAGDADEKKSFDMEVLKQFREREKKKNANFDYESRRRVKERMVNYLKSMQHLAGYVPHTDGEQQGQKHQRSRKSLMVSSSIRRTVSAGDYSGDEQPEPPRRTGRSASSVSFSDERNQEERERVEQASETWRRRVEFENVEADPIWMTQAQIREFENRRYTFAGDLGSFLIDVDEPEYEHYV